jgi:hypothetical protein
MKHKSEAFGIYKQFQAEVKAFFKTSIKEIHLCDGFVEFFRTDGGGEYIDKEFEQYLRDEGVFHETTAPDTPEQNELTEHMNQTICNAATVALIESGLPKSFWTEAMLSAVHVIARSPAAGLKGKTPYEIMFRQKVDPLLFQPFGCHAYTLIPKKKRKGKFGAKAHKCIMLGYEGGKKAYRLLDLETRKIISSWHVKFDEMGKIPLEDLNGFEDDQGDWGDILRHQRPSTSVNEDSDSGSNIDIEASQSASPPTDHVIVEPVGAPESISAAFRMMNQLQTHHHHHL